ncbi:hypothetical protein NYO98_11735 [Nocardioides sp. STR2]|uniref:Capsular polysaccharide biosynthesis protein n=1 Tax=Nocardioides pini TaxID=2975053 RepID=A0ABT4CDD2_9ACTN|nr:hypothetical protein [Nocardioides pini]MCY4726949.1 hypothetical protein [Nocardioides pini]
MDKPALIGVARRRWYVLLAGLMVSLGLAYAGTLASPPHYAARALVLLLPSQSTVGPNGNPFLDLSGLDLPARVVVSSLTSTSTREAVGKEFPDIDYAVSIEESTRGPVIALDVTGPTDGATLEALPYLMQESRATLERLQAEVEAPANATIRSMVLAQDRSATEQRGGTVRLAIAGLIAGLVATLFAASAIDGRSQQRRATRREHEDANEDSVSRQPDPAEGAPQHARDAPDDAGGPAPDPTGEEASPVPKHGDVSPTDPPPPSGAPGRRDLAMIRTSDSAEARPEHGARAHDTGNISRRPRKGKNRGRGR